MKSRLALTPLLSLVLSLTTPGKIWAQPESPGALPKSAETFDIAGHKAVLYASPKPAAGKPWVWYAPTLGGVSLPESHAKSVTPARSSQRTATSGSAAKPARVGANNGGWSVVVDTVNKCFASRDAQNTQM
jgi:hypothetical protein